MYDNLGNDEGLTLAVDQAVRDSKQDDWRGSAMKTKKVRIAVKAVLESAAEKSRGNAPSDSGGELILEQILELVVNQNEY